MSQWEMMLLNLNPSAIPRGAAQACLYCGTLFFQTNKARGKKYCTDSCRAGHSRIRKASRAST